MSQEYESWAHLNDEGMKEFGDLFPEKTIPILSIINISFEHPDFEETQTAYILKGKDLTEEQLNKLTEKIALKFKDKKTEVKQSILANKVPIRICLTSGAGTKNVHLFLPDGLDWIPLDWMDTSNANTY